MKIKKIITICALSCMLAATSVITPLHNAETVSAQTFLRSTSFHNRQFNATTIIDYEYDGNTGNKTILSAYTYSSSDYYFQTITGSSRVIVIVDSMSGRVGTYTIEKYQI